MNAANRENKTNKRRKNQTPCRQASEEGPQSSPKNPKDARGRETHPGKTQKQKDARPKRADKQKEKDSGTGEKQKKKKEQDQQNVQGGVWPVSLIFVSQMKEEKREREKKTNKTYAKNRQRQGLRKKNDAKTRTWQWENFFGQFSGRNRSSKTQILAKNTPNDTNQPQTTELKSSLPKMYVKKRP